MATKFGDPLPPGAEAFQSIWEAQKRGLGNRVLLELWKNDGKPLTVGELNSRVDAPADEVVDAVLKAREFKLVDIEPTSSDGVTNVRITDAGKRAIILE